ncbi:MAG: tandem-95 repeat protein, partial [Chitinophagales bacterium]|nr:tandem-95 repeat protein [Chitinophagales bacterium]
ANDSDPADGTAVSVVGVVSAPTNGVVTLNANGSFTYTPNANFSGTDVFCYNITDAGTPAPFLLDTACVTITVVPVNDPPVIPDTTVTTCEDCPITVCIPYTDGDGSANIHNGTVLCPPQWGIVSGLALNQATDVLCFTYTPGTNYNGQDQLCIVLCDNGSPVLCDTSYITINVTPVNDPPFADTIYVVTYENQPIGVNVASATGDPEGNPLTYTYYGVIPGGGTYTITGSGAINVYPNIGFTGVLAIPYSVCDLSPYPVNVLCDSAAIIVTVLPAGDTLVNHAPIANNDYVTTPLNTAVVINELANDYDPDGDPLQVTVTGAPAHGSYTVNPNGTINYTPNTGYFGYDTISYTICDPAATKLPKPLCDNAIIVIFISTDSTAIENDPPVAVDDFEFICSNTSVQLNLLLNDSDPNGDALTSVTILSSVSNGSLTAGSLGIYLYTPAVGFNGNDTLIYRVCDNGTPSLCDTGVAVIFVSGNPVITPSVASLTNCSNDSVNITFTSSIPGTNITWTATNGTSGTGDIHTVITNTTSATQVVTYSVVGVGPGGCASTTITVPVTVKPRPVATASINGTSFCSGENVLINVSSNLTNTTYTWSGSNGSSGVGTPISNNPVNNGTTDITVTYSIVPTTNGCIGDTLKVSVTVKPKPTLTATPPTQTICSGTPITIDITSSVTGTSINWFGSNGNSGNSSTINDSPTNISFTNQTVTYTINGVYNGCNANTVFATVVVRPRVVADAGQDKNAVGCSASCTLIGGSPTGAGGTGGLTYAWSPNVGLNDSTLANPTSCGVLSNITYTVTVTDGSGCFATDAMVLTITPSTLTAEAGNGGALCLGSGDSVMLGGFPTAVGGAAPYTYTWSPVTGLNLTNPANPYAFPTTTTKYYITVTDQLGCTSVDSTTVNVYPVLTAFAGNDTTVCAGSPAQLGGNPTATGGSGSGYTYLWSPTVGLSSITAANPTATPVTLTTYQLTVTDANGCQAVDAVQVSVSPSPTAFAGPDKNISLCPGDSVILGDVPAATGGVGSYTYAWSPATGIVSSTTIANPVVKGIVVNTTYTLTVTDANGCSSSDAATINVLPNNLFVNAGASKQICAGNTTQLGSIPLVAGGTPPYTYTWVGGSLNDSTVANPVAQPANTTTYNVTVRDAKGCTASSSVTITVNPNPIANAGPDTTVCTGSIVNIGGSPTASSGTPGYSYSWSPTTGLSLPSVANPGASPVVVTTYSVTVTDSKGCASFDEVQVTPRTNPVVDAGADKTIVNCVADTACFTVNVTGGSTPYTYLWTPSTGAINPNIANLCVTGISTTTSYQLSVTDVFGCSGVDFVVVNVTPSTLQANAGNGAAICASVGSPVTIGGSPTAAGGTTPYTYSWVGTDGFTSNVSNPVVTPTSSTTYYVTVTDAKGCTSLDSVRVNLNPAPVANAGTDTTVCTGFCVQIGGSPTGSSGTNPLQYSWTPTIGLNANNVSNPLACPQITTTYIVQVTDSNNCQATSQVTITVRPQPTADAGADKNLIACGNDTITIGGSPSGSGGTGALTYTWSPATGLSSTTVSNPTVTGLTVSQLYTLLVTDAAGCSREDAVLVTVVPSSLTAEAGNGGAICAGSSATVQLGGNPTAVGGTPSYTYTWSGGLSNIANPVVSPANTTTYYLTVIDSKGCVAYDSVTVTVNPAPEACAGEDTAVCAGAKVRIGCNPSASGGTAPYTYLWSNGSTASNPMVGVMATTIFTLTVTDANGCSSSSSMTITVNPNPTADAGPDKTLTACSQDSVILGGSPTASGGTTPYIYHWNPAIGLNADSVANPYVKGLGSTANYAVIVTDANGCSATDIVTVFVNNPTLIAEAGNDVSFCAGASVSVTLGGTPAVLGGNAPFNFAWTSNPTGFTASVANPIASPVVSTTYYLVVTDGTGCIGTDSVRITINPRPVVNAGATDTICAGACVQLGGSPTAQAGTGTYTYNWTPTLFLNSSTASNPIACPTSTLTYQVQVVDSLGCSNTANVTIRVNQNPVANAGSDKSIESCPQACVTLGATPTATGGTGPYFYAWAPSSGLNNTGLPNPEACNLATTTTYVLTVTDNNGCTSADNVLVTVTTPTLVAEAGPDRSICAGQTNCITINGSVTGGTTPYLIDWSPVFGICNSNTIPNPDVNPTDTTTYVLLVTDAHGCISIDSMVVFANPAVTAIVQPDTAICSGSAALLGGIPATADGGTAPFTYNWNPGTGLSSTTAANPVATPLSTTAYCVTVTDAVGCSSSTCQTVTVNPGVTANAGPVQTIFACSGAFAQVGGTPTAAGGSGNYSYQWSQSPAGTNLNSTTIPNPIATNLTVTTRFDVTVTDNATGCSATAFTIVNVNQTTLQVNAGADRVFCANSTGCVNLGGTPTVNGGQAPFIYQWAPVPGLSNPNIANPCANPLVTTNYAVTVTDAFGCFKSDTVTVFVSPGIGVTAGIDTAVCSGSSITLGGLPTAQGGTGPFTYQWTPGSFLTSSTVANPTAQNVTSNVSYTVVATDSLGCAASATVNVNVRQLPIANAGPNATIFACSSDSAVLGGNPTGSGTQGPYSFVWSPNAGLNSPTLSNPTVSNLGNTTQFNVVVTDVFGCSSLPSYVTVTVNPPTIIVDAGAAQSICSNVGGCVTLTATLGGNGIPPIGFAWTGPNISGSPLQPSIVACPTQTSTYTVIVTDKNGCQAADTVDVIYNTPTEASISGLNAQYCQNAGNITMTGIPAGGTFSGPFVTGNIFQASAAGPGNWCVKYTFVDANGCSDDTTICVTVNPLPVVSVSGFNPAYCVADSCITLVGSPVGGTFTGAGVTGTTFCPATANLGNNVITYTYTDQTTGCTNSTNVTINVKGAPVLDLTTTADTVCTGGCVTITPNFSIDVFNIQWTHLAGGTITSGLSPITYCPVGVDGGVVATAINTPNGCITRDTVFLHVNQPPVASADTAATCEEESVTIPVLANDTDPEGNANTITVLSVTNGTATVGGGAITYNPALNFNGTASITYAICNTQCANSCDTADVFISVCPINDPPVIVCVADSMYANTTDTVCVAATDVDGDPLSVTTYQVTVLNGNVNVVNNCVVFTPAPGWYGTQQIEVVVTDTAGASDTCSLIIEVLKINTPPFAVKVGASVCTNTAVGVNVNASASDPDGDPLTFTYGAVSGPGTGLWTVTGNGTGVFVANAPGIYTIPYYACDQSNIPAFSLCDTNLIQIVVLTCDSVNNPPVASDDAATGLVNTGININELANDFDADGDPLTVTILSAPTLPGATVLLNADQTVTYTSPVVGCDSIIYQICDPNGACDTAVIYVCVNTTLNNNNPPAATDDHVTTSYLTAITIGVKNNDSDPDGDAITVQPTLPCPPADGVATVNANGTITYMPGPGANALNPDTFCYVICDNGIPSKCDTAVVVVYILNSVQAVNDCGTFVTGRFNDLDLDVLSNDFDPESDSFNIISVVALPNTKGTATLNADGTIHYVPSTTDSCDYIDSVAYVIQDANGALDTGIVCIYIDCCVRPVAVADAYEIAPNTPFVANVVLNDNGAGYPLQSVIAINAQNGTAVFLKDSIMQYTPNAGYCGPDFVVYEVRNQCGKDIDTVFFTINCAPVAADDAVTICVGESATVAVLDNDVDNTALPLTVTSFTTPTAAIANISAFSGDVFTITAGNVVGSTTFSYVVCDAGNPALCDTATVTVNVVACPGPVVPPIYDTTFVNVPITVCLVSGVNVISNLPWSIDTLCDPANGSVTIDSDSCFTYTPDPGFFGVDSFCIVICDTLNHCTTSTVYITVLDSLIQAVNEPCDLDTTFVNTAITLAVLNNDIIPWGADTTVAIIGDVTNGTATVNADNTITVTPALGYSGTVNFSYTVCVTTGSFSFCDSASVCVAVIDTACTFPNAFSPNGDGSNDVFVLPCNDNNPQATLLIFNRWGVEVWRSEGHYQNDFDGHNKQGTNLPDGTYYYVYEYNDGTGKREQKFVVIHR